MLLAYLNRLTLLLYCGISFTNAQTWRYLGLANESISALAIDPMKSNVLYAGSSSNFSAGTYGGIFKSINSGATWDTLLRGVSVTQIVIHPRNADTIFVSTHTPNGSPPGVLRTTNGGATWAWSDSGIYVSGETGVNSLALSPSKPEIMYAGTGGFNGGHLYKSTDGGRYWAIVGLIENAFTHIAFAPSSFDTVYVVTLGFGGLFKTSNGGVSWDTLMWEVGLESITIHPDGTDLYLGLFDPPDRPLAISTNSGITWSRKEIIDSTFDAVYSIAIEPEGTNEFYITAHHRPEGSTVLRTTDGGNSWSEFNSGLAGLTPVLLVLDPISSHLYSTASGVYVTEIPLSVQEESRSRATTQFSSYPNPFNGLAHIRFSILNRQHVRIRVYDLLGREIATILEEDSGAGDHDVTLDATHLASGSYFIQLQLENQFLHRKVVLLK